MSIESSPGPPQVGFSAGATSQLNRENLVKNLRCDKILDQNSGKLKSKLEFSENSSLNGFRVQIFLPFC